LPSTLAYILGIAAVVAIFRFFWRYFIFGASRMIRRDLRDRLYAHLVKLSANFFANTKTGDLMAHATNDVEAVQFACGMGILALADAIIMVSFSLAAMLSINWQLVLYAFTPLPLVTVFVVVIGRMIHRRFMAVQEAFSLLTEKSARGDLRVCASSRASPKKWDSPKTLGARMTSSSRRISAWYGCRGFLSR
jgi:ATP-binding cassette subfamily B multidrug efflux pump